MGVLRLYRAWRRALARERVAARLAVAIAENWRARGVFLRLGDGELFEVALVWARLYGAALALDGVEAGREARARKTADLCLQVLLSQGGGVLNMDGVQPWSVGRAAYDVEATAPGVGAEIGGVEAVEDWA